MKIKREPLLIDQFLAKKYVQTENACSQKFYESTRSNLLLAKRFVLDHDAARYCAELLAKNPRIIADAQDFAIPPFANTYIEFPFREWYEIICEKKPDSTADNRLGYLITGNTVRGIAGNGVDAGLAPMEYALHQPWTLEQEIAFAQELNISRITFDMFFWGASILKLAPFELLDTPTDGVIMAKQTGPMDEWQKEGLRSLRANHSFRLDLHPRLSPADVWQNVYRGSAGDLRNIIGLLLFLNRTSKTRIETDVSMQPGRWIGRRMTNLVKHRVISFSVNPTPRLIKLVAGEGIRKRLHDVRGHLCHNEVARTNQHDHDWIESQDNHLRWMCECGGLRWWRKPHMRGHESKGLVTSEYKITE